jgi:hypothetical protein
MPSVPPWRKMTWVLLIWTVALAILIMAGAFLDPSVSASLPLWLAGFLVLGAVWLLTRPRQHTRLARRKGADSAAPAAKRTGGGSGGTGSQRRRVLTATPYEPVPVGALWRTLTQ